jgi:type IV secretory pathway TraG/TraD family ATPase VirD4
MSITIRSRLIPQRRVLFTLGRSRQIVGRRIRISEDELFRHTLVLGTTGSGKTTAALSVMKQAIFAGWGVMLIDLKGDPDNTSALADAAHSVGARYNQFSITPGERSDIWQPLAAGDANARMSKVITLSEWSEPYYRSVCERFAQTTFMLLERNQQHPDFQKLIRFLDQPAALHQLTGALSDIERDNVERYLARLIEDRSQLSALAGLAARIGTLTDSAGPLAQPNSQAAIDVKHLSQHGGVVAFTLNSARSAVTAARIGTLAVLDIQSMVAERIASRECARPILVCVDEFSALDADHLLGLFARARSARVAMLLATQELADLSRVREGFAQQILGLTGTKIILRQEVAESANDLAATIGTQTVWKETRQVDRSKLFGGSSGMASRRQVEEFIIHPNTLKRLSRGRAILLRKEPFRCQRVRLSHPAATA